MPPPRKHGASCSISIAGRIFRREPHVVVCHRLASSTHQPPVKIPLSTTAAPCATDRQREHSWNTHGGLSEHSRRTHGGLTTGREGKGRERKGEYRRQRRTHPHPRPCLRPRTSNPKQRPKQRRNLRRPKPSRKNALRQAKDSAPPPKRHCRMTLPSRRNCRHGRTSTTTATLIRTSTISGTR